VGFFGGGKLKKIDTRGGPPIELADAPVPWGGAWSPNGIILFSPNYLLLQKISSGGGRVTPATDTAAGNLQCCPSFLPDGEHYLFAAQAQGDSQGKLLVGALHSTASEVIGGVPAVYAQGRLLYLKDSTLVAQPFDVKARRPSGEPEAVAEGVGHYRSRLQDGFFTVSSTGILAYVAPAHEYGWQLTWFDRTGKALSTIGEPRVIPDIELSPDRKRLAISTTGATGNADIWTYDLARGSPTRFTFDPAEELRGVVSGRGQHHIPLEPQGPFRPVP
jgi:hypothetical protein